MLASLKAPLAAIMLSSVAMVPAATVAYVATADVAFAKSDKAGGGGGKSASAKSKSSKGTTAKTRGKSGTKSASGGSKSRGHGGLDKFFDKLTGKDKQRTKAVRRSASAPKVASASPKKRPEQDGLHPSELGKMNGALNANENAILAHIRNGNMTNGPVGLMAGYAYYSVGTAEARELLGSGTAAEYQAYQDALAAGGGATDATEFQEWYDDQMALDPLDRDPNFESIVDTYESTRSSLGDSAYQEALGDYATFEDYLADTYNEDGTLIEGAEPNQELEDAYTNLGTYDAETADAIENAGDDIAAYDDALASIYSAWNKGDAESENADDLKAMLDARVAEYEGVEALYDEMNPPAEEPTEGDDVADCEEGAVSCDPVDEEMAASE